MRPDVPALRQRIALLQLVRLLATAAVVGLAVLLPDRFTVVPAAVVAVAALVLAATAAVEIARRRRRLSRTGAVRALLLADAVLFAVTTAWSGQVASPLLPLPLLEIVAVTILLSWRAGAEAALFDSTAFTATHLALVAGIVPGAARPVGTGAVLAMALAFGACTALTGACTSYDRRALQQGRRHSQALSDLALALEHVTGSDTVSTVLAERVSRDLAVAGAAVLVPDRWATAAVSAAHGRVTRTQVPGPLAEDPLVRRALRDHGPVQCRSTDPDVAASVVPAVLPGCGHLALLAMRLTGDELGGVLAVAGRGSRPVGRASLETLRQAAAHGAAALRTTRLLAELERQAARDPLTGLANRRALDETLEHELSRSRRDGSPLSLVLFDVDHFKAVNDEHGHLVGDQVLRAVARRLAAGVRDVDLVARLGGEEFVVLLPATAPADAVVTADRLRREIAEADLVRRVTVSAGVAAFPRPAHDGPELLARADAALYEAKRTGRDRVVSAAPERGATPLRTA